MTTEREVADIVAAWKAARDRGEAVPPEEVIRQHPERAAELRHAFAALALLDRVAGEVLPNAAFSSVGGEALPSGAPERIGDFRLIRPLGIGATGNVYEAEQISMRRKVALKVLHPSMTLNARAVERFQREARLAGRLHHTNIVPVHAMGTERGLSWFAMELVNGHDLSRVIEDLRLLAGPIARTEDVGPSAASTVSGFGSTSGTRDFHLRVARAFADVADALHAAHLAGVVHRDVKPSNLLLDVQGRLNLLDFGLARASEDGLPALTVTGDVVGTPSYMAPEQVQGRPVDGRTDVYSLGATLYELLTLAPPFRGTDVQACLRQILTRDPIPPRRRNPRIPRDLETVVLRALEKEPDRRFASAEAMARDLRAFADGRAIASRRIGPALRAWRAIRRHRLRTALIAAVLLLASAAGLFHRARIAERAGRLDVESARRQSEYERLLAQAAREYIRDHGRGDEEAQPSRELHARAIALSPARPEAWFQRALCADREPTRRLEDLAAAEARGFSARAVRLLRALLLRQRGLAPEALAEERAAQDLAWDHPACQLAAGRLSVLRGDLREAEALLSGAIGASELASMVDYDARRLRARVRAQLGEDEAALRDLDAVLEMGDHAVDVTVERARLWRRMGDAERADRLMSQALAPYLLGATLHQWKELCAHSQAAGEYRTAAKAARAGLREHPRAWALEVALSRALTAMAEPAAALEAAGRAVALADGEHDAWCTLAAAKAAHGDVPGGLEAARKALALEAGCPGAQATLGTLLLRAGEAAQAAEVLGPLSRRDAYRAEVATPYLQALLHAGRFADVVGEAQRLLAEGTRDAYPEFAHGTALIALERFEEALEPLRRAAAGRLGRIAPARANLAHAYERLGRMEEAIEQARESVLEDDGNAASHLGLARLLLKAERSLEALPSASRAADLAPSLESLEALLRAQVGAGRPAHEFVAVCDRALRLDPGNATWRMNRAVSLNLAERFPEAEKLCDELLAQPPEDAGIHLERAKALAAQGRGAEAQGAVDAAARLAPGDPAVDFVREEIRERLSRGTGGSSAGPARPEEAASLDARLLSRFAAIQDARDDTGDAAAAARAYEEAFRSAHIDVTAESPEAVAAKVRASTLGDSLEAALDAWRAACGRSHALRPALDAVLRAVDTDPWRTRVRSATDLAAARDVAAQADLARARIGRLLEVADLLTGLGAGSEARTLLVRVAAARPAEFRAQLAAGLACARDVPPGAKEAADYYAAARALRPSSATPLYLLGTLRRAQGDLRGAAEAFRSAIGLRSDHGPSRAGLASALEALGDLDGAERTLREAVLAQPGIAGHRGQLAELLAARNRPAEALEALRVATALEPDNPRWRVMLGRRLREANLCEEAVRQLTQAAALAPEDAGARRELGRAEQQRGNLDQALEAFRAAVRLDESSWEAHRLLAWVHTLRGDVDDAVREYRRVKDLRPEDDAAWNDLAASLYVAGDGEAAQAVLEEALGRFPDSIVILGNLGRQRQWAGRMEEALSLRQRAHQLAQARGERSHPTAAWLAEAEQAVRFERRLEEVVRGEGPRPTATEAEDLANVAYVKGLPLTAARLYVAAFDADPAVRARDLNRWAAAGAALAVGSGQGAQAERVPEGERARWLVLARGWAADELDLLRRRAASEPDAVRAILPRLQRDKAFALVRSDASDLLPTAERTAWARLWEDLATLQASLAGPPPAR